MTKTAIRPIHFAENDWGPAARGSAHIMTWVQVEGFRWRGKVIIDA